MPSQTKTDSKFTKQIIGAILVVVGVVAGVTFISQFQSTKPFIGPGGDPPPPPPPPPTGETLDVPLTKWQWEPESAGEIEEHTPGHHDFWFQNKTAVPLYVGMDSKSCKCSSVSICFFSPEEKTKYVRWAFGTVIYQVGQLATPRPNFGIAEPGLLGLTTFAIKEHPSIAALRGMELEWYKLKDAETVTVPPKYWGLVRLHWDGKKEKLGKENLTVGLWTQAEVDRPIPKEYPPKLELPITFVKALRATPGKTNVETLGLRDERTVEYVVWSSTRAKFSLAARETSNDKCIRCACVPMTQEELIKHGQSTNSRALAGYRVLVTVRERLSEAVQMELGPFARRIALTSDALPEEEYLLVTGAVRGDIMVGSEEDRWKIDLKSFPARKGTIKRVLVTTELPDLELKRDQVRIEPESLNYLKVTLNPLPRVEGKPRWELIVQVPPNGPGGRLPEHSAILLQIPGNPPRHVRAPIGGLAYQQ